MGVGLQCEIIFPPCSPPHLQSESLLHFCDMENLLAKSGRVLKAQIFIFLF